MDCPGSNRLIQFSDWLLHYLRHHYGTRRSLWLSLSFLLFCWNTSVLWASHQPENIQILNLLLWLGVLISIEDQLVLLWPKPSKFSLLSGLLIVVACMIRGGIISNDQDRFCFLLLPLLILTLALLCRPLNDLSLFRLPLVISLLLPASRLVTAFLPSLLNPLTAKLTWILLYSLGFAVSISDSKVLIGSGGVDVLGPCSGVEQLIFTISTATIFLLVFPMQNAKNVASILLSSVVIAVLFNSIRIAILAWLTSLPAGYGMPAFYFLHDSYGSLLFSLLSIFTLGWFYLWLINRELSV